MLRKMLNQLSEIIITNHPTVDYGGCCVVAAHVAKYLSKIVPTQIVLSDDNAVNLTKVRKLVNNSLKKAKWDRHIGFAHVLVEFKYKNRWYAFDATNGVVKRSSFWKDRVFYEKAKGHLTIEEASSFANTDRGWNHMFDRDEIPELRRSITKFFKRNNLQQYV